MNNSRVKVGSITLAVSLVIIGILMLVYNFNMLEAPGVIWKLWPLLLIGVGVEYFVRKLLSKQDMDVQFHIPSILLIVLIILIGSVANMLYSVGVGDLIEGNVFNNRESYNHTWQSEPIDVAAGLW